MIRASRNKLIRGISDSNPRGRSFERRGAGPALTAILFLGTTAIAGSAFYLSSANDDKPPSSALRWDDARSERLVNHLSMATSALSKASSAESPGRAHATAADEYFRRWRKIPLPPVVHDNLESMISLDEERGRSDAMEDAKRQRNNKILVIGDVHGCLEELLRLVQVATREHNNGERFAAVVLVGDLCNKGPYSAQVVRHVRNKSRWYSVRGNHDDGALTAALGDEERRSKPKYQWVNSLSDDDVAWMSNLPYTITIPGTMLDDSPGTTERKQDVIIVHAGFDPAVGLENQETKTMITVRELRVDDNETAASKAWAKAWRGPELVVFGHDARRGLQREDYAVGLDSGCVYGGKLTGMILPEGEFVSVDAMREHSPIEKKGD